MLSCLSFSAYFSYIERKTKLIALNIQLVKIRQFCFLLEEINCKFFEMYQSIIVLSNEIGCEFPFQDFEIQPCMESLIWALVKGYWYGPVKPDYIKQV